MDNISNLLKGQIWKFEAIVFMEEAKFAKFLGVTCWQ